MEKLPCALEFSHSRSKGLLLKKTELENYFSLFITPYAQVHNMRIVDFAQICTFCN